jgi:TPP-dependent pyruvate/acetoin dehydrogenase alpha subunit
MASETDRQDLLEMFRTMVRIRLFEQAAYDMYMDGELPGFMHISIGQEATSVGACSALGEGDYLTSTHRGHGDTIARGLSISSAMAELMGKSAGACKAKGGSMHVADFSLGILGANGIVGAGMPIAIGSALSSNYLDRKTVTLCFFGDGAMTTGPTHEAMNMATLWNLPVVFVRQNNLYAESTPVREYQGIPDILKWAESYGMPATRVDGNDVQAVHDTVLTAVERARSGGGPSFVESETYRWFGHNIGDPGKGRPPEEVTAWKARDPLVLCRNALLADGADEGSLSTIESEEQDKLAKAIELGRAAALPKLEDALTDVYGDETLAAAALGEVRR